MIDPLNSKPQPAGQPVRPLTKKRPWPPWRLIATLPELEIAVTDSKIRPVTFSNRNKKDVLDGLWIVTPRTHIFIHRNANQAAPSCSNPSSPSSNREPEKWNMTHLIENARRRPALLANNPPTCIPQSLFRKTLHAPRLPSSFPFPLMPQSAVLDFAVRSCGVKNFCGDCRSVELRALCNDSPRTPPGPEGSNGNGSASCAAEYPKFHSSQPELNRATGKAA